MSTLLNVTGARRRGFSISCFLVLPKEPPCRSLGGGPGVLEVAGSRWRMARLESARSPHRHSGSLLGHFKHFSQALFRQQQEEYLRETQSNGVSMYLTYRQVCVVIEWRPRSVTQQTQHHLDGLWAVHVGSIGL